MFSIFRPAFSRAFSVSSSRHAVSSNEVLEEAMSSMSKLYSGDKDAIKDFKTLPVSPSPRPVQEKVNPADMFVPPAEDPLLSYVASRIMKHGRRQHANRVVARTLLHIHAFTRGPPLPVFRQAIFDASPAVRVMSQRHSTKTFYKPIALSERKRTWYAVEWILHASSTRPGRTLEERLAQEMISVVNGDSEALKKKETVHKMAMVNRGNVGKTTPS